LKNEQVKVFRERDTDEFIALSLEAMTGIAEQIGL